MIDIYKYAAQNYLLFASNKGMLTVADLFDLPLTSKSGFDLDNIAKAIHRQIKSTSEESFVTEAVTSPQQKGLEIALDVVKDVIATKQAANAAELAKRHRAEERKKILDAIGAKKDQQLSGASLEELEKKLAELDG